MVDKQASELKALENISRDASAKPIRLTYALIESITEKFAHEIGRGGFGVVYLGFLGNGRKVAVKELSSTHTDANDDLFTDEINSLLRSRHENIVRFFGYCADTQKELYSVEGQRRQILVEVRRRFLCFEYVPEGDLQHYLKEKAPRDEWRIRLHIIKGICRGLWYLHNEGLCHLDIKPQNVLLDAHMEPKITDFGLSRFLDKSINTSRLIGTLGYIPPEGIDEGKISFKSDVFSLGIIIIKLLIGHGDAYDLENWHESLELQNLQVKACVEIARKCTDHDPRNRPTIREIVQNLELLKSQVPSNVPAEVASKMKDVMAGVKSFVFPGQARSVMAEVNTSCVYPTNPEIGIITTEEDPYVRVGKTWIKGQMGPSKLTLVDGDDADQMQNKMRNRLLETMGKDGQAILYITNMGIIRRTCDDCKTIRVALMSLRVEFIEKDADKEEPKQLFLDRPAFRLPVLCKGKHFIEGSELMKFHDEGKLAALIK